MELVLPGMERLSGHSAPHWPWRLVGCIPPQRQLQQFQVDSEGFIIGRRPGSNLQVVSPRVSGRHAELLTIGKHLFIRDLGSTNGTYVNRRRIEQPTPIAEGDHIEVADVEFRVEREHSNDSSEELPTFRQTHSDIETIESDWVLSQLDMLIRDRAVTPHYQAIVTIDGAKTVGYEALARSEMCGLESPHSMFDTARMVNREVELSMMCRQRAVEIASRLPRRQALFVNTHPMEDFIADVLPSMKQLRRIAPEQPIVVEIHEAAIHDPQSVREFHAALKDLNIRLAYDDFGAGRSRLMELVKAPPDFLKFDASLIRNLDSASPQQMRLLSTLIDVVRDFNICTLAEGIETVGEMEACRALGFELAQGFYFGIPLDADDIR
ncbi:Phytochrome-like protein cph2 [Caulifigura coniformis]|uniref:Phytochrome-like protein cph2 n=1 Tax=Caulifigura coniformis TaxID=2527983 RepID=A0A517SB45_9PLAN|nr:EAL domain-containing protein [Caulifigura coniformis]QDT53370.1 Phytochrome-like protein cph2 [Caulifigura coniformis]